MKKISNRVFAFIVAVTCAFVSVPFVYAATTGTVQEYTVKIASAEHGSVVLSDGSEEEIHNEGDDVNLFVNEDDGFQLASLTLKNDDTGETISELSETKFVMPANNVSVEPVFTQIEDETAKAEDETVPDKQPSEDATVTKEQQAEEPKVGDEDSLEHSDDELLPNKDTDWSSYGGGILEPNTYRFLTSIGIDPLTNEDYGSALDDYYDHLATTYDNASDWYVGKQVSGSCAITGSWRSNYQQYFSLGSFSGGLAGATVDGSGWCANKTAAAPEAGHEIVSVTGTVTSVDTTSGLIRMSLLVVPTGASWGSYDKNGHLYGYQRVGANIYMYKSFNGSIKLNKSIKGGCDFAASNSHYSLQGAVYKIYKDANCTVSTGYSLTTDANGNAQVDNAFSAGTYYVKEFTAPKGFALDPTVYPVTVVAGSTAQISVTDVPQMDPVGILLKKVDAETGKPIPTGQGTLKGAQYTMKYYREGQTTPERTWVFETNENGFMHYSLKYLVKGDQLYSDANGIASLPLGSVTLQETKAPIGYAINPTVYTVNITPTNNGSEAVHTYNEPTTPEKLTELIKTAAKDDATAGHVGIPREDMKLIDTVTFENLAIGETYTLKGTIMDKETGEPLLIDGEKVTAEKTFVPTTENGSTDVVFNFDASKLQGKDLVCFEKVFIGEKEILSHEDITDDGQTIRMTDSEIHTSAIDKDTAIKSAVPQKEVTFIDTVSYHDLVPGITYKVKGILMDKSTGEPLLIHKSISEDNPDEDIPTEDEQGETVESETTFVPEEADGTVDVEFTFDASDLKDSTIVVFEELYFEDTLLTEHKDIEDEGQTIIFPDSQIHTTLTDDFTGMHGIAPEQQTLHFTDKVAYENLIPGLEYKITGVLMDKTTGKPFLVNDEEVTGETVFTPEEADGIVEVTFEFDAEYFEKGQDLVAFEKLFAFDTEVASHEDIEDTDQTIHYPDCEIHTAAKNKDNGSNSIEASGMVTVVDTVEYKDLIPGMEYVIKGVLMDKETGNPIKVNLFSVTGETTFTPEEADGSIDVEFTFDASSIKTSAIVVFEKIYMKDIEVASHEDINDQAQTIIVTQPAVPQTGVDSNMFILIGIFVVLLSGCIFLIAKKRKPDNKES